MSWMSCERPDSNTTANQMAGNSSGICFCERVSVRLENFPKKRDITLFEERKWVGKWGGRGGRAHRHKIRFFSQSQRWLPSSQTNSNERNEETKKKKKKSRVHPPNKKKKIAKKTKNFFFFFLIRQKRFISLLPSDHHWLLNSRKTPQTSIFNRRRSSLYSAIKVTNYEGQTR